MKPVAVEPGSTVTGPAPVSAATPGTAMPTVLTAAPEVTPVPETITKLVDEYARETGVRPIREARPSTPEDPRAHLPQYRGLMPGELPRDHPEVRRRTRVIASQRARERERDKLVLAAEARVPSRLKPDTDVVVTGSAKVQYEDKVDGKVNTDHRGARGTIFNSYVDREGVRRQIIKTEDGAVLGVRECDLTPRADRKVMSFARPCSPEERAALAAQSPDAAERRVFGGRTSEEIAALLMGGEGAR